MLQRIINGGAAVLGWLWRHLFWILGFSLLAGVVTGGVVMLGVNQFLWTALVAVGGGAVLTGLGCVTSGTFREWILGALKGIDAPPADEAHRPLLDLEDNKVEAEHPLDAYLRNVEERRVFVQNHGARMAAFDAKIAQSAAKREVSLAKLEKLRAAALERQEAAAEEALELPLIAFLRETLNAFKTVERDEKLDMGLSEQVIAFMASVEAQYQNPDATVPEGSEAVLTLSALVFNLNLMLHSSSTEPHARPESLFESFFNGVGLEDLKAFFTDPISGAFLSHPVILSSGQTVNESTAQRLYDLKMSQYPGCEKALVRHGHTPDYTRKSLYDLFKAWGCFERLQELVAPKTPLDLDVTIRSMAGKATAPVGGSDFEEKQALLGESSPVSRAPFAAHHSRPVQPLYARTRVRSASADLPSSKSRKHSAPSPFV